jgi:hypothetical protein
MSREHQAENSVNGERTSGPTDTKREDSRDVPVSEPTQEQEAACERAMDFFEAQADIWADEIDLVFIIKNIGDVSRKLTDRMPLNIREGFINRQEANIDALMRQAYLEGFMRGGDSRKEYDEARIEELENTMHTIAYHSATMSDFPHDIEDMQRFALAALNKSGRIKRS